ncbi:MAG TPA: hypothetical protein VF532_21720 [Candidatus Angelobacter sp.]
MYRIYLHVAVFVAMLSLVSCSETPSVKSAETKPENTTKAAETAANDPVSGKTAFWQMYKSAHSWSADLVPLSLESKTMAGMKSEAGRSMMWTATFGSLTKREARTFTFAVAAHGPDVIKGVTVGRALPWSGPRQDALAIDTSDLSVDSDAAFKAALAEASAWVSKHPDKQVSVTLGNDSRFPAPVWLVMWGDRKLGYAVHVNAKTGAVVKEKQKAS